MTHPAGVFGHGEQRNPVVVIVRTRRARGDHDHVGAAAIDDEAFGTRQPEAVARTFGAGGDAAGAVFGGFVNRHGEHAVARDQSGEITALHIC